MRWCVEQHVCQPGEQQCMLLILLQLCFNTDVAVLLMLVQPHAGTDSPVLLLLCAAVRL